MTVAERQKLVRNILQDNIETRLYEWKREVTDRSSETINKNNPGKKHTISQLEKPHFGLETPHFTNSPGM